MFPSLQPSRPKPPQHSSHHPPTQQQQQRRVHVSQQSQPLSTPLLSPATKPQSQIEAMPPFGPTQTPATFFTPVYDSAIRHPVFFTQHLKKPPFPIPQAAAQSWNPVASGYVAEQRRNGEIVGKTKL
ncbi:hypothetical protein GMOD_00007655 [Pyrenophora seminiperda CCB06]|uniref:Uncharacterized protein n=1 Tax=Pyrenophora seminiperda CCB06 TaxID=1302712 RepID=A0A3M7MDP2_9PLEO|nr:hypothetical protein GMOD_00007655 [Pyrenophora seminiperda CCB06]